MMDSPKDAPPQDYDFVRDTLVKMMSIRSGERFQVITYREDDGGADDKRDYASVTEAARAARAYVQGKDGSSYDGALVYDRKQKSIVRLFGFFPEYARPVCARAGQKAQEEQDR